MEKILKIEEGDLGTKRPWLDYIGFRIITNEQTILIGIDNQQRCCEKFGCITTNDDISDFIGSELKSISLVDKELNNLYIGNVAYMNEGGVMFVNLETSKGLLQFVAYNGHNGYYGHDAVIVSKQLNHEEEI